MHALLPFENGSTEHANSKSEEDQPHDGGFDTGVGTEFVAGPAEAAGMLVLEGRVSEVMRTWVSIEGLAWGLSLLELASGSRIGRRR